MKEPPYFFLKKNCFVCKIQSHWIVLNAESDRYLTITDGDLATISSRIHGCRDLAAEQDMARVTNAEPPLIVSLVANGVLTTHPSEGKPFQTEAIIACAAGIGTTDPLLRSRVSSLHLYRFLLACAGTAYSLRIHPFVRTIERLQRRQSVLPRDDYYPVHAVTSLIAQFRFLRPFYPRPYVCLFDSIALLDFLARHNVHANLVFGVVADPFTAHCWIQRDDVVLNDDIESLRKYTPILSL